MLAFCANYSRKIFADSELQEDSVIRKFRITAADGKSYDTQHYSLSAIIAVSYKVNSERAVQFRKWATGNLTVRPDAGAYRRNLNQRLNAKGGQRVTFSHGLKLPAPDGKQSLTDCANTEGLFRIIQSNLRGNC